MSIYLQGMRDRSMRSGTKFAREIQLTDWSTAGNLSNRSSGVQIPRDICTRFGRYLYSTRCSWIINSINFIYLMTGYIYVRTNIHFILLQRTSKLEESNREMQYEKENLRREIQILSTFLRHHACSRNPTGIYGGSRWNTSLCGEQSQPDPDVLMYVNVEQ